MKRTKGKENLIKTQIIERNIQIENYILNYLLNRKTNNNSFINNNSKTNGNIKKEISLDLILKIKKYLIHDQK